MKDFHAADMVDLGVSLIPENRKHQGLALILPVAVNIVVSSLDRLFPKFFISKRKEREIAMQYVDKLRIATPSTSRLAQYLSGGNQPKVVLAKWLCGLMKPNISERSKNAILPGWIDTDLTATARTQIEGLNERVMARTPAKRWGSPDDFAGITIFLASAASDFVTGTAILIDGGYSIAG
jgi:hypothetical protein